MHTQGLTTTLTSTRGLFFIINTLTVLFLVLYVYCIFISVANVVKREEMLLSIANVQSEIGELEARYLAKKEVIDSGYAQSLGFVPIEKKTFVTVPNTGRGLTINQ